MAKKTDKTAVQEDLTAELEKLNELTTPDALTDEQKEVLEKVDAITPDGHLAEPDPQASKKDLETALKEVKEINTTILEPTHHVIEEAEIPPTVEPDYDPSQELVSIYVSSKTNVTKNKGFDDEGQEGLYTEVKVGYIPQGREHHVMETHKIWLDTRCLVPRFVAEVLGDRADVQEYYPQQAE